MEHVIENQKSEYNCIQKNMSLRFDLDVKNGTKSVYQIISKIVPTYQNELLMTDADGKVVSALSKKIKFTKPNEGYIMEGDKALYEFEHRVSLHGETYDVQDPESKEVLAHIIMSGTRNGVMKNVNDEIIATCSSNTFSNDYVIQISRYCKIQDYHVIMLFTSVIRDICESNDVT